MRLFSTACAAAALFSAAPALALTTIDFSTSPASFLTYSQGGATISTVNNTVLNTTTVPGGSQGILPGTSPFPEYRVDFATVASFVSVDLGDNNADPDLLFLEAFSAANVSLGFTSFNNPATATAMTTLSLSVANIKYAIFGGRPPALNGNSVYADNVRFELGAVGTVPEASTWALMLAGFGIVGAAMRRRQKVSVSFA